MDYVQFSEDGNQPLNVELGVQEEGAGVTGLKKQVRLALILAGVAAVATVAIVLGLVLTKSSGSSDNSPTPMEGSSTSKDQQYQSYTVSTPDFPMASISLGASKMLGGCDSSRRCRSQQAVAL